MIMLSENGLLYQVVYRNKIQLICEAFTFATVLDIALSLSFDGTTSHEHLLSRLIITILAVLSLAIFKQNKLPTVVAFMIHFVICVGIMLANTWISGCFWELHPRASWYAIQTMLIVYPIFVLGIVIGNVLVKKKRS